MFSDPQLLVFVSFISRSLASSAVAPFCNDLSSKLRSQVHPPMARRFVLCPLDNGFGDIVRQPCEGRAIASRQIYTYNN